MAEKDITEKVLEDFNDVFADIVNGLLFQGEQVIQEHELMAAQPVSMYKADGNIHEQERDVSKYWIKRQDEKVNVRIAFLGIENQTKYDETMPLRVLSYDGSAYRAELATKNRYPVITLVLYFGDDPWGTSRSLYDVIPVPERFKPFVSDYKINVFEIAHLPEEAIDYFHSDFRIVVDYFVHKKENPDYRPSNPEQFKHVDELLKLMSVVTNDDRFTDSLKREGGKPKNMCEALDYIENKGKEIGKEIGKREGADWMCLEMLHALICNTNYSPEKAMEVTNIPMEERERYAILLKERYGNQTA